MSNPSQESKPEDQSRSDDLVDRTIGEFRLLRRLGSGGMADVYLAEQPSLQRVVAIKVLQPGRIAGFDSSIVDRFQREARAAGGLSHANIVQVYQTGEENGIHFIVQEYIQGNNLAQQIRRVGPPNLYQGLQWMQQIANALHAADQAGIVHRDIKPENIMLTRDLTVKVTDFGLAQLSQQGDQKNLTQTGIAMGTPLYMSPEQVRGSKVDFRSDQYSFGVTCYHMYAGRPPFSSGNPVTVAVQHLQDPPPPLAGHRADLPPEVCNTIHRMMSKEPSERFQSSAEVLRTIAPLHQLPINSSLRQSIGIRRWFPGALPAWRLTVGVIAATILAGTLAGQRLAPRPLVPDIHPVSITPKASAAQQFAEAMLNPRDESGWLAIREHYPDSDEWRYAQLHLAMLYLSRIPPESTQANLILEELVTWTDLKPAEYRRLRALAVMAEAMAARQAGKQSDERVFLQQLRDDELLSEDDREDLSEIAPPPLRNYANQILQPNPDRSLPQRRK
ncbi:MAG: serine/threonine protein kinase [Fuerstiella sp.]|nr:serine/threonine protein kinase [Fuerstiella sp.]